MIYNKKVIFAEKNHKVRKTLFVAILFPFILTAQQNNENIGVPTFQGGNKSENSFNKKKELVLKTLDFISEKTDSLFLKRMKLKENDSIEFQVSYIIDKYGLIEKDSTLINTPITSFNNYMKLIIAMLPRFTPATGKNGVTESFEVEFVGRFNVKNNKLNHFQYEVNEYFISGIDKIPIFPGCENSNMPIDRFNQKISEHISDNFKYPREAQEKMIQGRIQVQFTIDEFGNVTDIKTGGPKGAQLLKDEAYRIISLLPKFIPGSLKGKNVKVRYAQPITFGLH